jgi:MFS family permease
MTSKAVLRSYFAISGVYTLSASLIWGVNTLFLLEAGLDIFGVFVAGAAFTAGNVLFEIPTGVVADTVGRRASFLCSVSILSVGTLAYVGIPYLAWKPLVLFTVASVFLGLGFSFYSGALEAWLVDALDASGFEGELDAVFSRSAMVSGTAMLIGTVGGGLLGQLDLSLPFLARSGLLALAFVVALLGMRDLGFDARPLTLGTLRRELATVATAGIRHGWSQRSLRLLMLASAVQTGFIIWGFYAWQPYFQELLETDAVWFAGLIASGVALSTMLGNAVVDHFARLCGRRTTLLVWAASIQTLAAIAIGLSPSFPLALLCLFVVTSTMGVVGPVRQAYIHKLVPGEKRATVVSFDSMVANLGGVGGQAGLGYLAKVRDYATGYVVGGAFTVLAIPLYFGIRGLKEDADKIIGKAGKSSPCAAQGLAWVGAVDDKTYTAEVGTEGDAAIVAEAGS